MSSRLVEGFADALVRRLVADGLVEIEVGGEERVIAALAARLASTRRLGDAVVPTVIRGLLDIPEVVEVFVDDDALRELIRELPTTNARGAS